MIRNEFSPTQLLCYLKQRFLNLIKSLIFSASEDSEWRVVKWMFKILGQKQDPSMNFINCWPWSVDFSCLLISTERLISLQMCLMVLKSKSWIFLILLYFWLCLEHSNEMKLLFEQFLKSKVSVPEDLINFWITECNWNKYLPDNLDRRLPEREWLCTICKYGLKPCRKYSRF